MNELDDAAELLTRLNRLDEDEMNRLQRHIDAAGSLGALVETGLQQQTHVVWAIEHSLLVIYGYAAEWATLLDVAFDDIDGIAGTAATLLADGDVPAAVAVVVDFLAKLVDTVIDHGKVDPVRWAPIAAGVVEVWQTNPLWSAVAVAIDESTDADMVDDVAIDPTSVAE